MKKTYQKPVIETAEVEIENMIAASLPSIDIGESNYNGTDKVETKSRGSVLDNIDWD